MLRKPRACLSVVRLEPVDEARLGDSAQKLRTLVRVSFIDLRYQSCIVIKD
jgi:hypothetical protein